MYLISEPIISLKVNMVNVISVKLKKSCLFFNLVSCCIFSFGLLQSSGSSAVPCFSLPEYNRTSAEHFQCGVQVDGIA